MYLIITLFDKEKTNALKLKGRYLESFLKAFPDGKAALGKVRGVLGFFASGGNAGQKAVSLALKSQDIKDDEITLKFETLKETDMESGFLGTSLRTLSKIRGWGDKDGLHPLACIVSKEECEEVCEYARRLKKTEELMKAEDYKGMANLFAPLSKVKDSELFWNSADVLYPLGVACSKLSVTLKIKKDETKKLDIAKQYREFCVQFLERGTGLEEGARCASALAYRYYSNVHELTRPGERKDQNLEEQIEKANEWLSRAIEVYPQSIRNNYRKGKLIIEKQAPYLLFGKKSFGEEEARLLREIREVGEEHLASAIALYEALEDEKEKEANRREYAKALFVLGGYYLDDAYLPVHEYYFKRIAGRESGTGIQPISRMDIESAIENLEKCFGAETDMPLTKLDTGALAANAKSFARSPVEKLYRLGCAYGFQAFIYLVEGNADKAAAQAKKSVYYLEAAKAVSDKSKDRKRNTWHISEKSSWAYMHMGQYERAAKLLENARSGYIINTYAIALLMTKKKENATKAKAALEAAAKDKRNLAMGLTRILLSFVKGEKSIPAKNVSSKNKKLAGILGIAAGQGKK